MFTTYATYMHYLTYFPHNNPGKQILLLSHFTDEDAVT